MEMLRRMEECAEMSALPQPKRGRGESDRGEYQRVRDATFALCDTLAPEDTVAQSMPDTSPAKWHLAHTTWFFEQFLLVQFDPEYRRFHDGWDFLFNSYYQTVGPMHARPHRGLLTRPTLADIRDYRSYVDVAMERLLARRGDDAEVRARATLGLNHEQQHQELLLTDIKHAFWCNPLRPAYRNATARHESRSSPMRFLPGRQGPVDIGDEGEGFAYDNETPRHTTWLSAHALANRLVTNAEYLAFVRDGGYHEASLWLSDGWARVQREGWQRPLYWQEDLSSEFTLAGVRALDPHAPVCHISYFEADAFARWAGARLPTEAEWEDAASRLPVNGNFQDNQRFHPTAVPAGDGLLQMYGDVWEWTGSPYVSYPGFKPLPGALGEYNGKFMNGQWVLRGGSCATPRDHIRASYRNFFPPHARWQFAGIRLGQDR